MQEEEEVVTITPEAGPAGLVVQVQEAPPGFCSLWACSRQMLLVPPVPPRPHLIVCGRLVWAQGLPAHSDHFLCLSLRVSSGHGMCLILLKGSSLVVPFHQ